jgi:hypothetical protein
MLRRDKMEKMVEEMSVSTLYHMLITEYMRQKEELLEEIVFQRKCGISTQYLDADIEVIISKLEELEEM